MRFPMNAASNTRSPLRLPKAQRPYLVMALGMALVVLVGSIDYVTGVHVFVLVFYLLPIFLVSWYVPRPAGVVVAVISAAVWLVGQWWGPAPLPPANRTPAVFYWNVIIKMGFLILFAVLLALLKAAYDKEKTHARTDDLTGVANRRHFFERAEQETRRSHRYKRPMTVVFIDIDDFKIVNDRFGHETGDALLQAVGNTLHRHLRETDIVGRLGGDEFVVLMPETQAPEAEKVLEKLRRHLLQTAEDKDLDVTFSIGAVAFPQAPDSVDEMIAAADKTMYSVKKDGKDRVQLRSA
jgi:diguanylate cyclase (GGDEF)-like protein